MTDAKETRYVYVTFIRTTPQTLWSALTAEEFTRQYWRSPNGWPARRGDW